VALAPETAMRSILINDGPVSAIVSSRVYLDVAPQGAAFPFIVLSRASSEFFHHTGGPSGLNLHDVDLDMYGEAVAALRTLATAVQAALDGNTSTVSVSGSAITFAQCFLKEQADNSLQINDGSGRYLRVIETTYRVGYQD
jgi:hypothetical protein